MLTARTRLLSRGRAFKTGFRKPNARNVTQPEPRLSIIRFDFQTRHSVGKRNGWKISSFRKLEIRPNKKLHGGVARYRGRRRMLRFSIKPIRYVYGSDKIRFRYIQIRRTHDIRGFFAHGGRKPNPRRRRSVRLRQNDAHPLSLRIY